MSRSMSSQEAQILLRSRMASIASASLTANTNTSMSNLVTRQLSEATKTCLEGDLSFATKPYTILMPMVLERKNSSPSWTNTLNSRSRSLPTWSTSTTRSSESQCWSSREMFLLKSDRDSKWSRLSMMLTERLKKQRHVMKRNSASRILQAQPIPMPCTRMSRSSRRRSITLPSLYMISLFNLMRFSSMVKKLKEIPQNESIEFNCCH